MNKKYIRDIVIIALAIVCAFIGGKWMMASEAEYLTELLDNVGIIIGLVTAAISIFTWFNVRRINEKLKNYTIIEPAAKDKEAVLAITIGKASIADQVKQFLLEKGGDYGKLVEGIPLKCKERFSEGAITKGRFSIDYHNREKEQNGTIIKITTEQQIPPKELTAATQELYDAIHLVSDFLRESGVNRIRIFYAGIGVFCFFIGDEFANNYAVSIYHYYQGSYIYAGDLGRQ